LVVNVISKFGYIITNLKKMSTKCQKKWEKKWQLMSYNMMIGYDIYDYFTMEHFRCVKEWPWRPKFIARDCTLRSFKFIIKVGCDFKIRLSTPLTSWFGLSKWRFKIQSFSTTVNWPFHILYWILKRHFDNSNPGVSGVSNIILFGLFFFCMFFNIKLFTI
jgi:hypothetical protein